MLTFDLFTSKVKFASPFVWAIYIYIESIEVTCRSTVVKIVLIGNLRWPIIWFIFIIFPCHCAVYMYKIMILQKPLSQFPPNFTLILLLKCD